MVKTISLFASIKATANKENLSIVATQPWFKALI